MSDSQTTPGPWTIQKMDNGYGYAIMAAKRFICSVAARGAGIRGTSAKAKADANLIAAAPELVEALTKLCLYLKELEQAGYGKCEDNPLFNKAIAALGKAGAI